MTTIGSTPHLDCRIPETIGQEAAAEEPVAEPTRWALLPPGPLRTGQGSTAHTSGWMWRRPTTGGPRPAARPTYAPSWPELRLEDFQDRQSAEKLPAAGTHRPRWPTETGWNSWLRASIPRSTSLVDISDPRLTVPRGSVFLGERQALPPCHPCRKPQSGSCLYNDTGELDKAMADFGEAIRLDPGAFAAVYESCYVVPEKRRSSAGLGRQPGRCAVGAEYRISLFGPWVGLPCDGRVR